MGWVIDRARTRIGFSVKHMLVSTARGEFTRYQAQLEIDRDDFTRSSCAGSIEVDSLDTGSAERDSLLRSHGILGGAQHPRMMFQSTQVRRVSAQRYVVSGQLTLRGIQKPVELDVSFAGVTRDAAGRELAHLQVRGVVSRKAFGVSFGVLEAGGISVGDKVNLELDVLAVADEAQ